MSEDRRSVWRESRAAAEQHPSVLERNCASAFATLWSLFALGSFLVFTMDSFLGGGDPHGDAVVVALAAVLGVGVPLAAGRWAGWAHFRGRCLTVTAVVAGICALWYGFCASV